MRFLTIVRHVKAEKIGADSQDLTRPLTIEGRKSIKRIARLVHSLTPPVDLLVSSHAHRAQETADLLATQIDYSAPILRREEIYEARAMTLLVVLQGLPEDAQHAVLVGHNPGLKELVAGLCSGATNQLNVHLAPGGVAHIELEIYWWNQIRWGAGGLHLLTKPKILRK